MPEVYLTKSLAGYYTPANEEDKEQLTRVKSGDTIKVKWSIPRNYKFLQKYMVLMRLVFDNLPEQLAPYFPDVGDLRKDIIIESGYFDIKTNVRGETRKVAKSISFGSMKEEAFEELYNKSINTILKHYLIGTLEDDLRLSVAQRIATNF